MATSPHGQALSAFRDRSSPRHGALNEWHRTFGPLAKESVKDESFTNGKQTDFLLRRACVGTGELLRLWIKKASKPFFLNESISRSQGPY